MHFFSYPSEDATLYELSQSINTGLDSILEIRKDVNADGSVVNVSRILIKFDLTFISKSLSSGLMSVNTQHYLNLYDANTKALLTEQTLYVYPVSQSWSMGQGKLDDNPSDSEGVSWRYRNGLLSGNSDYWVSGSNNIGGTWFSGSNDQYSLEASQSYVYETRDMRMDVTGIVNNWVYSGSAYPNQGFIVKRSGSYGNSDSNTEEGNTSKYGQFQFFSSDTNTIYVPKLESVWDDSTWSTGSLSPLTGSALEESLIYMKGLRPSYKENSKAKIRLVGRERYPTRTFSTTSANLIVKYLPSGSTYYSIRNAHTEDILIPFGSGSKVSCDSTGNYISLWMNAFQPEQYYRILYKVVSGSGTNEIDIRFDENWTFLVER